MVIAQAYAGLGKRTEALDTLAELVSDYPGWAPEQPLVLDLMHALLQSPGPVLARHRKAAAALGS